jgi:hypothetical protein
MLTGPEFDTGTEAWTAKLNPAVVIELREKSGKQVERTAVQVVVSAVFCRLSRCKLRA